MNRKLNRILDEIQKTEERIAEWQEHLKELNIRKKQLEDAEIIKSVRSMRLNSRELLEVLDKIQNGTAVFPYPEEVSDTAEKDTVSENIITGKLEPSGSTVDEKEDGYSESEN